LRTTKTPASSDVHAAVGAVAAAARAKVPRRSARAPACAQARGKIPGSGALTRWLLDNQLVDEISLLVCPVVVGQGTRLFPDAGLDMALDLVDSRAYPKGITLQVYRPAGRPQYATDVPTPSP
jgi:dihydrofolate reductase